MLCVTLCSCSFSSVHVSSSAKKPFFSVIESCFNNTGFFFPKGLDVCVVFVCLVNTVHPLHTQGIQVFLSAGHPFPLIF